jgi:hypothetical protein
MGGQARGGKKLDRHGWSKESGSGRQGRVGAELATAPRFGSRGAGIAWAVSAERVPSGGGRWSKGAAEEDVGRDIHEGDVVEWGTGARRRGRLSHRFQKSRVRRGSVCWQVVASCLEGGDLRGALVEARGPRETRV